MNKTALFLTVSLFSFSFVKAQHQNEVKINPTIEAVTVYLNGAEIKRSKAVEVKKGINQVIFQKLSPYLDAHSVQVSVDGDAEVQSVTTQSNFLNIEKLEPRIKQVKDSVTLLYSKIVSVNNQLDAYNEEKALLDENKNIGNKQAATSVTDIEKAAEYYRQKTLDIDNSVAKLNAQKDELNRQLSLLQNQLVALNYKNNPERTEVAVVLNSDADKTVTLHLRYTVSNAGWEPMYDLISTDVSKPTTLKYKAKVYNNTGLDWEKVPLTLSTADPSQSASRPYLSTWTLDYANTNDGALLGTNIISRGVPARYGDVSNGIVEMDTINREGLLNTVNTGIAQKLTNKVTPVKYKTVAVSELTASFAIANPYTIPSDAKPYEVDIASYSLDAGYSYVAVPKLDRSAFLVAKISGWEKLNLMDGPMNVYFKNAYVGQSAINTRFVEDTLELSLGRDNQILVTRTKKEDMGSKKLLGSTRKESFKYEIVVKNNKKQTINIEVQDQLPVSLESDIVVDADDISGASHDLPTGKLKWNTSINPGASVTYNLVFSVKYPKNKQVPIRKFKTISCPSF